MTVRIALTLGVFLLTLFLILRRPRGLHEAWAAALGGGLMLALGLETPREAWMTVAQGGDVLLFLLGLMVFSALMDRSGFFEWAAIRAAGAARGDGRALYRNVFLLGAVTTALLSLDTTAILLTPLVLAFVRRLDLPPRPFLLACAFIANTGSLLLPISNLTNLLFQSAFHWTFWEFARRMLLPQIAAVGLNWALFARAFRREIPQKFDPALLPPPETVIPDRPFFQGTAVVFAAMTLGYFAASLVHLPPFAVALAGAGALLAWGLARGQVNAAFVREISWPLFPFVAGLFVIVRAVQNCGVAGWAARTLAHAGPHPWEQALATAFGAGLGANAVNNIPMALLAIRTLQTAHAAPPAIYGALVGCNLGPNLTVTGSLATMLVITSARRQGADLDAWTFFRVGLWATPILLAVAAILLQ